MIELSNCCGATREIDECDICSECGEHADFYEEERHEDYEQLKYWQRDTSLFDAEEYGDYLYHKRKDEEACNESH